jgi:hypothetical protein
LSLGINKNDRSFLEFYAKFRDVSMVFLRP